MTSLLSLFRHLVLPVQVPRGPDEDLEQSEQEIVTRLQKACLLMENNAHHGSNKTWTTLANSLESCRCLHVSAMNKDDLLFEFQRLQEGRMLILHIVEQNAGLLVSMGSRDGEDTVVFECFEASPKAESVLESENALVMSFPGRAAEIPITEFRDSWFQDELAGFLHQAHSEYVARLAARAKKAGVSPIEHRDVVNPALVSQMLLPLLEAIGGPADVPSISKRVRDEVNMKTGPKPWRRSPFWLVLRVAIRRLLLSSLGIEASRVCYKFLICALLANFLQDCSGQLSPELSVTLQRKLCRRLAKLSVSREPASPNVKAIMDHYFTSVGLFCERIVKTKASDIEVAWESFKSKIQRRIPRLPQNVHGTMNLSLTLPNSRPYLVSRLKWAPLSTGNMDTTPPLNDNLTRFADKFLKLTQLEDDLSNQQQISGCLDAATAIQRLLDSYADEVEDVDPQQMSARILCLSRLWVTMDRDAVATLPLLGDYHPVFQPEIFDALQLETRSDMEELRVVQEYVKGRIEGCRYRSNIWSDPSPQSFTTLFAQDVNNSHAIQWVLSNIQEASDNARADKTKEWQRLTQQYDKLCQDWISGICRCCWENGEKIIKGCTKCWYGRRLGRLKIVTHEDFLPHDTVQRWAIGFELAMPAYLRAYRAATWRIFRMFLHPNKAKPATKPDMELAHFPPYVSFSQSLGSCEPGLASSKKSFGRTHYSKLKMQVALNDVLYPFGSYFQYYDSSLQVWVKDLDSSITLQHICGVRVGPSLSSLLPSELHPPPTRSGPSSYQVVANSAKCPIDMSPHEFSAHQRLFGAQGLRWHKILVELGASNINFSSKDSMNLICQLALEVGKTDMECGFLGHIHVAFRDDSFCIRLYERLKDRLNSISRNWREVYCMETLLTLILRLYEFVSARRRDLASELVIMARKSTLNWIKNLNAMSFQVKSSQEAKRLAYYSLWASLLCRRSFATSVNKAGIMTAAELHSFVTASINLQQNLAVNTTEVDKELKRMFVRDFKMVQTMSGFIQRSIEERPGAMREAIRTVLSSRGPELGCKYSTWNHLEGNWMTATFSYTPMGSRSSVVLQVLHYNFILGHLYFNGKPIGTLPSKIRDSDEVQRLFGSDMTLLVNPSSWMPGMDYTLATSHEGFEVHFGTCGNRFIIRICDQSSTWEYIHGSVFCPAEAAMAFDLPDPLVRDCVHWLNLNTRQVEIRRRPKIWSTRVNDWRLNLDSMTAHRGKSLLLDPNSDVAKQVQQIFMDFAEATSLEIYQPDMSNLTIQIRKLELQFSVGKGGFLYSRELGRGIYPDQDAGVFYGLKSAIILRPDIDSNQRSIIVPVALGNVEIKRYGVHIVARVEPSSTSVYCDFKVDNVLKRLKCAPEPLLKYSMAFFHAITSFPLPDSLTGRTGCEEALHILGSAACRPWNQLEPGPVKVLHRIAGLSPGRQFYPRNFRTIQSVAWSADLTVAIQDERYEGIVTGILDKSLRLGHFNMAAQKPPSMIQFEKSDPHLHLRGIARRGLYERRVEGQDFGTARDIDYKARDRNLSMPQAVNVFQTARLLLNPEFSLTQAIDLGNLLQQWELIAGFKDKDTKLSMESLGNTMDQPLNQRWGPLVKFCQAVGMHDIYRAVFRLCLLAFADQPDMDMINCLAAFVRLESRNRVEIDQAKQLTSMFVVKTLRPPRTASFSMFCMNPCVSSDSLTQVIKNFYVPFHPALAVERHMSEAQHREACEKDGRRLASLIASLWPDKDHSCVYELDFKSILVDVKEAKDAIADEFKSQKQNLKLAHFVKMIQGALDQVTDKGEPPKPQRKLNTEAIYLSGPSFTNPSLLECLRSEFRQSRHIAAPSLAGPKIKFTGSSKTECPQVNENPEMEELQSILRIFSASDDPLRREYGKDLEKSLGALKLQPPRVTRKSEKVHLFSVGSKLDHFDRCVSENLDRISDCLAIGDPRHRWLSLGGLWPHPAPREILEQLRCTNRDQLGNGWKGALIKYGIAISSLQRCMRLADAIINNEMDKIQEETSNEGHQNWDPEEHPDWLLLELDSDLLIRPTQIEVANAIISPASGANSVLQMNMGQVPMVMVALADKSQLARLVVPKALILQTAQTLQSRIGGLVGRSLSHISFTRRTPLNDELLDVFVGLHREMAQSSGVILTTPEHVLSFQLSGLQHLVDGQIEFAKKMIKFQTELTSSSRDVLDESDFSLAVKTQLIYPSGSRTSLDGHPHRWRTAQILLQLVLDYARELKRTFPHSINVVWSDGRNAFPQIHLLRKDVEVELNIRLVEGICAGKLPILRLKGSHRSHRMVKAKQTMRSILCDDIMNLDQAKELSLMFQEPTVGYKMLLLCRGLIRNKVLILVLKKRWNVQYGLDTKRAPIAVPFEAKGVPSDQAEYGHPDVAILFTCLAFYHSGLTLEQFTNGLRCVIKSDDPTTEYDKWTASSSMRLPPEFERYTAINLEDGLQVERAWKVLGTTRSVVDHYMNTFVFPQHAKQFSVKLQTSGWDLPLLLSPTSKKHQSGARTSGFSGTNDNKILLPMTIRQEDLPSLHQTNAEVLRYLLLPRNRAYEVAIHQPSRGRLTEVQLLRRLKELGIRILIDAGAYILEMGNEKLANEWLTVETNAPAAVFFFNNKAWATFRNGKSLPLLATPYAEDLGSCLVYVDEAHIRGTDLKFRPDARGALTLALGQTKDHTVQAAMRMRKLATSQSITFFAPPEVDQSIADTCFGSKRTRSPPLNTAHVIHWLLEQTCQANHQLQTLYYSQGIDFVRRKGAHWVNPKRVSNTDQRKSYLDVILHSESQTLEEMYGGLRNRSSSSTPAVKHASPTLEDFWNRLGALTSSTGTADLFQEVEHELQQEEEQEQEVEEVRQVQKPPRYTPCTFPGLHPAIASFVKSGRLSGDVGYENVFAALSRTVTYKSHNLTGLAEVSPVFVSTEFMRTITKTLPRDDFLRTVEWVLWSPSEQTALVLIAEEAEIVLELLRRQQYTNTSRVHLAAYAPPVTRTMGDFHRLDFYMFPPLPPYSNPPSPAVAVDLGLFAGRLYFDFAEYKYLCYRLEHLSTLGGNVSDFFLDWLSVCRRGQDVLYTPMGYVCQGRTLNADHVFFSQQ